jgi:hypothetical protein
LPKSGRSTTSGNAEVRPAITVETWVAARSLLVGMRPTVPLADESRSVQAYPSGDLPSWRIPCLASPPGHRYGRPVQGRVPVWLGKDAASGFDVTGMLIMASGGNGMRRF